MAHQYSEEELEKQKSIAFLKSPEANKLYPIDSPIPIAELPGMEEAIKGRIVYPWSPAYNKARREFNNVYPAEPKMIIYVQCWTDIRECLAMARKYNMHTVIRSGAHSLAGYSVCDGMVIDMTMINDVTVDPVAKTVTVGAGTRFQKLFPILEQYHLHVPGGGCPSVAVAGYMQGGGYGLTSRMYGMQCDNVIEVVVMLYDGKIVVANEKQNQDMLWAVCGGTGGNFGVLLQIKYRLYQLENKGNIFGARLTWEFGELSGEVADLSNAANALSVIQETYLKPNAYPNMGIEIIVCHDFDPSTPITEEGVKKVYFGSLWNGTLEAYQEALQPLLDLPGVQVDIPITEGSYSTLNGQMLENTPPLALGIMAYSRSAYIEKFMSTEDWISVLQFYSTSPNRYTMIDMECYGAAINNVPVGKNSFIHRNVNMDFFCDAFFNGETNDQKENEVWLEKFFQFMSKFSNTHSYQNYPNRSQTDYKWAYWGESYNNLVEVKNKYDPTNFFHYQQSVGTTQDPKGGKVDLKWLSNPIVYETY